MKSIKLLIGSVDGAATFAGTQLKKELTAHDYQVSINNTPRMDDLLSSDNELLLIITSTTGEGELPHDLRPLWRKLYTKKPSLLGIRYAIAVLGDSSFGETFCLGGKKLDTLLEELKAEQLKPTLLSDIEENAFPEDEIVPWGLAIADTFFTSA